MLVPKTSLVVADLQEEVDSKSKIRFKKARFRCLSETWRNSKPDPMPTIPLGKLLTYLNPVVETKPEPSRPKSVKEHLTKQMNLLDHFK